MYKRETGLELGHQVSVTFSSTYNNLLFRFLGFKKTQPHRYLFMFPVFPQSCVNLRRCLDKSILKA